MSNLLDVLMRLKNAKNLDARQSTMVDNAFFQCKPPDRPATVVKHRPPLQEVRGEPVFRAVPLFPSYFSP